MTAVIGAAPGTYFTLRIYKKLVTNPSIVWSNFYELTNKLPPSEGEIQQLISDFIDFEKQLHLPSVEFDRAVFSSWVEDDTPYDPESFIVLPVSGNFGIRAAVGDPQPLHVVAFVRRVTQFGQNGKIFYRRSLTEGDVVAPAGTPAFSQTADFPGDLALALPFISQYLSAGAMFNLVMKSNLLINREVVDLVAAGVRVVQFNNRYFDVPNSP